MAGGESSMRTTSKFGNFASSLPMSGDHASRPRRRGDQIEVLAAVHESLVGTVDIHLTIIGNME